MRNYHEIGSNRKEGNSTAAREWLGREDMSCFNE